MFSAIEARQVAVQAAAAVDSSGESFVQYDYDVFVIGGGSGGVRTARTAADHGGF
jgi:heterodisulfide reductase subunit A-like polyferredoxin